jgi:hypothetical protein
MLMLYRLSYSWYEDYSPRLLEGPEVDNWSGYCDSLLPEAVEKALSNSVEKHEEGGWIGWDEIIDAMVDILVSKGYKLLEPEEKIYWGSNIIRDAGDSGVGKDWLILDKVKEHNTEFEKYLYKDRIAND